MTTCWACETELRSEWKFCIRCGVPVETDGEHDAKSRSVGPLALFGWIFAAIGVVLVIAVIISYVIAQ